jgi:hypothetical protein
MIPLKCILHLFIRNRKERGQNKIEGERERERERVESERWSVAEKGLRHGS